MITRKIELENLIIKHSVWRWEGSDGRSVMGGDVRVEVVGGV